MIETARLLLRPWRDVDREPMHRMGRDSKVMEFLGPLQSRAQSDMFIDRMIALQEQNGHCFWALERQQDSALLGLCGLKHGPPDTPIATRSEEHTSELQSLMRTSYAVFCLKKKKL